MSGSTRANFLLRAVRPNMTEDFAIRHNSAVWRVFAPSSERLWVQWMRRSLLPCLSRAVVWGLQVPTGCAQQPILAVGPTI